MILKIIIIIIIITLLKLQPQKDLNVMEWSCTCLFSMLNVYHPHGCHLKGQSLIMWPAVGFLWGGRRGRGQFSAARASAGGASRPPSFAALLVRFVSIVSSFALLSFSLSLVLVICSQGVCCVCVCVCVCVHTLDSSPSLWLSKAPFWGRGEEGSSMLLLSCDCDLSLVGFFLSCWDPTSYCWEFLSRQALYRRLLPVLGRGKFAVSVSVDKSTTGPWEFFTCVLLFCCSAGGAGWGECFCGI